MACNTIQLNDIGTLFKILVVECTNAGTVPVDVSTASDLQLKFQKPSGVVNLVDCTLLNDGTDGYIKYISIAGDFDEIGTYKYQGIITMDVNSVFNSTIKKIKVEENI